MFYIDVLGVPGSLDPATDNRGSGGVDPEGSSNHGEGDGQPDSNGGPHVGRGLREKPSKQELQLSTLNMLKICNISKFSPQNIKQVRNSKALQNLD